MTISPSAPLDIKARTVKTQLNNMAGAGVDALVSLSLINPSNHSLTCL